MKKPGRELNQYDQINISQFSPDQEFDPAQQTQQITKIQQQGPNPYRDMQPSITYKNPLIQDKGQRFNSHRDGTTRPYPQVIAIQQVDDDESMDNMSIISESYRFHQGESQNHPGSDRIDREVIDTNQILVRVPVKEVDESISVHYLQTQSVVETLPQKELQNQHMHSLNNQLNFNNNLLDVSDEKKQQSHRKHETKYYSYNLSTLQNERNHRDQLMNNNNNNNDLLEEQSKVLQITSDPVKKTIQQEALFNQEEGQNNYLNPRQGGVQGAKNNHHPYQHALSLQNKKGVTSGSENLKGPQASKVNGGVLSVKSFLAMNTECKLNYQLQKGQQQDGYFSQQDHLRLDSNIAEEGGLDFEGYETPPSQSGRRIGGPGKSPKSRLVSLHGSVQDRQGSQGSIVGEKKLIQEEIKPSQDQAKNQQANADPDQGNQLAVIQNPKQKASHQLITHYDKRSLFIFKQEWCIRQLIIRLVDSKWFEYSMVGVILVNSLTLSLYDYNDRDSATTWNKVLDKINLVLTAIYIAEAAFKILAKGLVWHKESYLRSGWNIIDAIVVISGIIELFMDSVKLKSLRVIRVFRPFKTINVIPSMRKLISALIQSLPEFANVGAFLLYVFVLFATMGLHTYNGAQYNICRYSETPTINNETNEVNWPYDWEINRVCSKSGLGNFECPSGMYCGNQNEYTEIVNLTLDSDRIMDRAYMFYGIANFDNLLNSLLTVFLIINGDTWYQHQEMFMDIDLPIFGTIFMYLMIIVGQFFLMNLILAVIIFAFIQAQQEEIHDEIQALNGLDDPQPKGEGEEELEEEGQEATGKVKDGNQEDLKNDEAGKTLTIGNLTKKESENENVTSFLRPQAKKRQVANMFINSKAQNNTTKDPELKTAITMKPQQDPKSLQLTLPGPNMTSFGQTSAGLGGTLPIPEEATKVVSIEESEEQKRAQDAQTTLAQVLLFGRRQKELEEEKKQMQRVPSAIKEEDQNSLSSSQQKLKSRKVLNLDQGEDNEKTDINNASMNNTMSKLLMPKEIINDPKPSDSENGPHDNQPKQDSNPMKNLFAAIYAKKLEMGVDSNQQNGEEESQKDDNKIARLFQRAIQNEVQKEYQVFFKNMVKEAKANYQGRQDEYSLKGNMRELVGLKVGLQMIKSEDAQKEKEKVLNDIEQRLEKNRFYRFFYNVTESQGFIWLMAVFIVINTLVLALDRHPIDRTQVMVLEKINIVFTVIFALEMVVKLIAVGIKSYFVGSWFNVFDSIIVIASLVDIIVSNFAVQNDQEGGGSAITALRGFRLLRVFKLAKNWKRFELLLETMGKTLVEIVAFSILLVIFLFCFTLLGLELFANKAKLDLENDVVDPVNGRSPKYNFDNFLNSFTTVFIFLSNDATTDIYTPYYRAVSPVTSTIFYILLVVIGQKILLNLFLAILLEEFDEGALKQKMHELEEEQKEKSQEEKLKLSELPWELRVKIWFRKFKVKCRQRCLKKSDKAKEQDDIDEDGLSSKDKALLLANLQIMSKNMKGSMKDKLNQAMLIDDNLILEGKSLGIFSTENKFRKFIFDVISNRKFDYFIVLVIIVSAVQLAIDPPNGDPNAKIKEVLFWIDMTTTIIFIMEAVLKIIALGFIRNGHKSYLRQSWNIIDFLIIIFSIMSLTPLSDSFRTFKIFRILRLLRLIGRNEQLQVAMRALFQAIPNVANVTIIMLLFFLIFGVIAVSYFKGKLYFCENPRDDLKEALDTKWDCLSAGGDWTNQIYNFDNSINALITLFVLSTGPWAAVMLNCNQARDLDEVPDPNFTYSFIWVMFFVVFTVVGAFFFLNLFVGVVISTFNTEHDKLGGNDLLTEKQKEWIELRLLVLRSSPMRKLRKPENCFRVFFFKIQNHVYFDRVILISIVLNTIVLMLKWYEQPDQVRLATEILNYIFTALFLAEALIRIIGTSPRMYFSEGWNIFDFIIILGSTISIFVSLNTTLELRGVLTVLRSFRILRILRLIKRGKSLMLIFNTIVITLQQLANIGLLLLLFIFMYSIIGMIIFGRVKRNHVMDDYINFENFFNAFITLFVVATGDTWEEIQISFAMERRPSNPCLDNPDYQSYLDNENSPMGCGSYALSIAFFVSYTFIVNLVFLKIFIAIILQGYSDTQVQDGRLFNHDMNDKFREVWTEFDPEATTFIKLHQLREFLFALGEPLGFDKTFENNRYQQDQFIASLELPTYHDFSQYQYLDVLDALSFRLMVLDHIKRKEESENNAESESQVDIQKSSSLSNKPYQYNQEMGQEIKLELQLEINKLIFQKQSENISAVKEISQKELKRIKKKEKNRDQNGLTSSHHMAAEATIKQMRKFLMKKKGLVGPDESIEAQDENSHRGSLNNKKMNQEVQSVDSIKQQTSSKSGSNFLFKTKLQISTNIKVKRNLLQKHALQNPHSFSNHPKEGSKLKQYENTSDFFKQDETSKTQVIDRQLFSQTGKNEKNPNFGFAASATDVKNNRSLNNFEIQETDREQNSELNGESDLSSQRGDTKTLQKIEQQITVVRLEDHSFTPQSQKNKNAKQWEDRKDQGNTDFMKTIKTSVKRGKAATDRFEEQKDGDFQNNFSFVYLDQQLI